MVITLEDGLYELCEKRILADKEFLQCRKYKKPINMTNKLFQEYRLFQLKRTLRWVYKHSRFYNKQFDKEKVSIKDIQTMKDLTKLPFTYPKDLSDTNYDFLCTSQSIVEKPVTFYSSGTTGMKKRIYFSNQDVLRIMEFISRAMNALADNEDTCILSLMQNSQGRGASAMFCKSVEMVGMSSFSADMEASSEENIRLSIEHDCNVWFGDIMSIYRIAKEMETKIALKKLGLKLIYVTMGNISRYVVKYLEKTFGCLVKTHYGLTEAGWGFAIDCNHCPGYHYNELDVIVEIIDPKTGEQMADGEDGEITITVIGRESMPLIRYRTGDISAFIPNDSECNQNLRTLKHIVRRLEGCYKVDEKNLIYPAMLEDILYQFPETVDYRPYIREGRLFIKVESTVNSIELKNEIEDGLWRHNTIHKMKFRPKVELLPIGALKKYCYEKKRMQITE